MYDILNESIEKTSNKPSITIAGKILIGLSGGVAVGLTIICAPFVSPALRKYCLPYIPATNEQLSNVVNALKSLSSSHCNKLIDLGSGDGRIVIETAKLAKFAHGVELNPWLVLYSKVNALKNHASNTKFYRNDLWKFNISNYDRVVIFGVESMMHDLEKKILKECNNQCKIIACRFPLPNMQPTKQFGQGIDTVWLYELRDKTKLN